MRRIQCFTILVCAAALAACQNTSGFEYHGPRLPQAVLDAAARPEPPTTPVEEIVAPAADTGGALDPAAVVAEPGGPPPSQPGRVLTPVPRTRVEGPAGPIVVPAPDRGRPVIVLEDTRTPTEVAEDKATYDRCILKAAVKASEGQNPWAPPGPSPQEICAKQLGLRERGETPENRRR